jgi:hypothetical protein
MTASATQTLGRTLLFSVLVTVLAACSDTGLVEDVEAVTVILVVDPTQVAAEGGSVTMTATVEGEAAISVDFAEIDADTALTTDSDSTDGYTATLDVLPPKTYVAVARNAEGDTVGRSNEVTVTAFGTAPTPPTPTPPTPTPVPTPGGPIPADAVLATTAAEVNAAAVGSTIVLTQNITCEADPCITLKEGQSLLGGRDGQLLTEPGISITTNFPATASPLLKSTVVTMANGSAVEGITFDGEDIYTAINAPETLTGDVTIRNVAINVVTSNNPMTLNSTGVVTVENLALTTTRPLFVQNFSAATLRGLAVTSNRPATSVGASVTVVTAEGTVVIDGLQLTTNLGGPGKDGVLVQSGVEATDTGALTVTVADSVVTFPEANLADSIAFNFNVAGAGTLAISEAESIGNSTNSAYQFKATYDIGVTGRITLP